MVRQEFPQVQLIECPVNSGYAYANNLGLAAFGFQSAPLARHPSSLVPRYALLLNPDTLLPPSALQDMLDFMARRGPDWSARMAASTWPAVVASLPQARFSIACWA